MSTCRGSNTIDLYQAVVRGQDKIPTTLSGAQDQLRARLVRLVYDCLITKSEKTILADRNADEGLIDSLKAHLAHLLLALLAWAHVRSKNLKTQKVPQTLHKTFDGVGQEKFTPNSLESRWK